MMVSTNKKTPHVPVRTCIGCGEKKHKQELWRFVLLSKYQISFDKEQNLDGRGAYLCKKKGCLTAAVKGKKLHKSFRKNLPANIYDQLVDLFESDG